MTKDIQNKVEMKDLIDETTLQFSRYTITDRAIPKVSDGFKAIHRRIVWSMFVDGLHHTEFRQKSINVAGSVLRFSPHGDSSVYDAMKRFANDSVNYKIIDGKGQFGKVTSSEDNGGASRYTEARLSLTSKYLLEDIKKNAVDMKPNYDEKLLEPIDLPAQFPLILANPNQGIAVGIATNIPAFDLKDLRDNVESLLFKKGQDYIDMYPTFTTGGYVLRDKDIAKSVTDSGRGAFRMRAKYHVEDDTKIIVTELPYGATVEAIENKIISMKNHKDHKYLVNDIEYVNDDTGANGFKFRIEVKKGTDIENLMNVLYSKTELEKKFSCNLYVLDNNNRPKLWGTKRILQEWIKFRAETIKRVANYKIDTIEKSLNVLYGLKICMDDITNITKIIQDSEEDKVNENIMKAKGLNLEQAEAIGDINIRKLNKTYFARQIKKIESLEKELKSLKELVNSKKLIADRILEDFDKVIKDIYIERKTEIVDKFSKADIKAFEEEDYNVKVIITKDGYLKKLPFTSLRGKYNIKFKDDDYAVSELDTLNSEEVLVFTDSYDIHKIKLSQITDTKPSDLGTYIPSLIGIDSDSIFGIVPLSDTVGSVFIGYEDGKVARVDTEAYRTKQNRAVLKNGMANKKAVAVRGIVSDLDVLSVADNGKVVLINTEKINVKSGKTTQGVAFQKLKDDSLVERYVFLDDSNYDSELEYYRVSSSGVGKNNRGDV